MNDLISREALYEEIARLGKLARDRVLDTPSSSPCYARYSAQLNERTSLKHIIADAPTAYDVEKVIEQLEDIKQSIIPLTGMDNYYVGQSVLMNEIITIIKRGGVDE